MSDHAFHRAPSFTEEQFSIRCLWCEAPGPTDAKGLCGMCTDLPKEPRRNGLSPNPYRPLSAEWGAWNAGWQAGFADCAAVDDREDAALAKARGEQA